MFGVQKGWVFGGSGGVSGGSKMELFKKREALPSSVRRILKRGGLF